jgi:probable rRNA maturation factor
MSEAEWPENSFHSGDMVIVRKSVVGLTEASLTRFVRQAARAVALPGWVNVLLTTNNEMRSLNLRFRGKNTPTDVLSFSPIAPLPVRFAGDIAISAEMAARNARNLGHSPAEEVKILALHGVMHLAGYDHEGESAVMARKEQRLRRSLNLPMGLIERTAEPNGGGGNASREKSKSGIKAPNQFPGSERRRSRR